MAFFLRPKGETPNSGWEGGSLCILHDVHSAVEHEFTVSDRIERWEVSDTGKAKKDKKIWLLRLVGASGVSDRMNAWMTELQ